MPKFSQLPIFALLCGCGLCLTPTAVLAQAASVPRALSSGNYNQASPPTYGEAPPPVPMPAVRFFEHNGVTYREARTMLKEPRVETRMETREQVVMKPEQAVETKNVTQTTPVVVQDFYFRSKVVGRWNPFVPDRIVSEAVPYQRQDIVKTTRPVQQTVTRWVPEKQLVQVPVQVQLAAERPVFERVAMAPLPNQRVSPLPGVGNENQPAAMAQRLPDPRSATPRPQTLPARGVPLPAMTAPAALPSNPQAAPANAPLRATNPPAVSAPRAAANSRYPQTAPAVSPR